MMSVVTDSRPLRIVDSKTVQPLLPVLPIPHFSCPTQGRNGPLGVYLLACSTARFASSHHPVHAPDRYDTPNSNPSPSRFQNGRNIVDTLVESLKGRRILSFLTKKIMITLEKVGKKDGTYFEP